MKVNVSVGSKVKKGDTIVVLEAVKMETPIYSPQDGEIVSVDVKKGDVIRANQLLVMIK